MKQHEIAVIAEDLGIPASIYAHPAVKQLINAALAKSRPPKLTENQRYNLASNKFSTMWNIRVAMGVIEDVEDYYGVK